ncbi:HU family DNA-binding protein [Stutzerimonas xanthomarina]|uniref:DNA-binding protein HU-beta n=1 Tax=Stutzerimonas xanthomarina TaxID=271420 RepID=A0A427DYR2_9GAMM|nr:MULTISPECIES: HU family DNA-binding protein [Stutzerimonas]KIL03225.1 transcriptional regulator HU subunit alpha [Stutzerimonas stutzeri]MBK3920050.1 DNA-binding protein HU [Stutzerimonas frequens]RRV08908.1 HU family DNA-binding protein [Stutzerimonas xanthomarina]
MNKSELVNAIAKNADIPETVARRVLDSTIEVISDTLSRGDSIALVGFGTFAVKERAERNGRNPKTGDTMTIAASKLPSFKPGKTLKDAIN